MNEENTSNITSDVTSDSAVLLDSEGLYNSSSDGAVELTEDSAASEEFITEEENSSEEMEELSSNEETEEVVEYSVVLNEDQYNELTTLQSFSCVCLGLELGLMIGLLFFMGLKK